MPQGLGDDLCGTDVVLLRLNDPLSAITPLTLRLDQPVQENETYSAIGFGVDESLPDRPSSVRKRGDGYQVTCRGAACKLEDVIRQRVGRQRRAVPWRLGRTGAGRRRQADWGGIARQDRLPRARVQRRRHARGLAEFRNSRRLRRARARARAHVQDDGPRETCALTATPAVGFSGRSLALLAALGLVRRRRNVLRIRRASRP